MKFYLLYIFCLLFAGKSYAAEEVTLSDPNSIFELFEEVAIFDNRSGRLSPESILRSEADAKFKPSVDWPIFLGLIPEPRSGDFWLKVRVHNSLDSDVAFVIHPTTAASVDRVFYQHESQQEWKILYERENLQRTRKALPLAPGRATLYVELKPDQILFPLILLQVRSYSSLLSIDPLKLALGLSYGVSLALLLYNIIFCFIFKSLSHVLYVFYNLSILFYYEGRYQFLAEQRLVPEIPLHFTICINAICSLLYFQFLCEILSVKKHIKIWLYIEWILSISIITLAVFSFFSPLAAQQMLILLLLISAPLTLILTVHASYLRLPESRILLFTTLLPGIGTALHFAPGLLGRMFSINFYDTIQMLSFDLEMILLSMTIGSKISRERSTLETSMKRAYQELQTIVYPHQVELIKTGKILSETMPVGTAKAHILVFDVVGSSKIHPDRARIFLAKVLEECHDVMMGSYRGSDLTANAFRIKEVGDGFICSIGFPFQCPAQNPASHSVWLAIKFRDVFQNLASKMILDQPLFCSIGIAYEAVEGYYPESGPQVYDLYGRGIVLASRYEAMRNPLFAKLGMKGSMIILQEAVFQALSSEEKALFTPLKLRSVNLAVRDDDGAENLYYNVSGASAVWQQSS